MATVQGIYISLFGRPADPAGLVFFNTVTKNGADLSAIGNLAGQPEYQERFKGRTNTEIVNSIYRSLFNRDADAAGLEYFTSQLNAGVFTINNIAIAIMDGAQNDDRVIIDNKAKAANAFTQALKTDTLVSLYVGENAASKIRAFIDGVKFSIPSPAAVDQAVQSLIPDMVVPTTSTTVTTTISSVDTTGGSSVSVPVTTTVTKPVTETTTVIDTASTTAVDTTIKPVVLTVTGTDKVSPTADDVRYRTSAGDDLITVTDFTSKTKIDAGEGNDTVIVKVAFGVALTQPESFAGAEKVYLKHSDGSDISFEGTSGIKEIWNDAAGTFGLGIVDGIEVTTSIGVRGDVEYAYFDYRERSTEKTMVYLDHASLSLGLVIMTSGRTTVLKTAGNSQIENFSPRSVETLEIEGSDNLRLQFTSNNDFLTKIDASRLVGGSLDLDVSKHKLALTITSSPGADSIRIDPDNYKTDVIVFGKDETSTYKNPERIEGLRIAITKMKDMIDLRALELPNRLGITTFSNIREGLLFRSNSLAVANDADDAWLFADSNRDGKLNLFSDFAVKFVGSRVNHFQPDDFYFV